MHRFPLLARLCFDEEGLQEPMQFLFECVPGGVDAMQALAPRDDDPPTGKDEHDDGRILCAVDEAREHAALEGALDVVLAVEELEVDAVVLEVHVDVPDDVLDLDDAALKVVARDRLLEHGNDLVRGEDTEKKVAAAGEHHFPGSEEEDGAVGIKEADGDGGELFLLEGAVGEDAVDELEVEGEAAAEDLGRADDVVHHDDGRVGHTVCVLAVGVVEVDVAGDAVIRHRDVMGSATSAAHGGGYDGTQKLKFF